MSDLRHVSDIHISQDSLATCLRCGGIFKQEFVANLLPSPTVKTFENRLTFGEVIGKRLVSCFLTHSVDESSSVLAWKLHSTTE